MDEMAGVRKSSGTGATRGVVYDLARARSGSAASGARVRGDRSSVTQEEGELSTALQAAEASDEVRAEKVRALREQIANGSYNPDPREIAKSLIERGF
jgi:negative regulator of flagellin synthesis FlgM